MMAEMREMGIDPMADLREMGYEYRGHVLYQVGSDERFQFRGQEHYDRLVEAVNGYVSLVLEEEACLRRLFVPLGVEAGGGVPIFVSPGFMEASALLFVIQGSGHVRVGVWGCSLCINKNLEWGTAMPYVARALAAGYGVVLVNPNQNVDEDGQKVRGSETADRHVGYVWEHLLDKCAASAVDVVAHSAGGRSLMHLLYSPSGPNARRIRRIILTDSYHTKHQVSLLPASIRALVGDGARTVNFVPHLQPLGTPVEDWSSQEYHFTKEEKCCECISAGTTDHASVNHAVIERAFEFLLRPVATLVEGGLCKAADADEGVASTPTAASRISESSPTSPLSPIARFLPHHLPSLPNLHPHVPHVPHPHLPHSLTKRFFDH